MSSVATNSDDALGYDDIGLESNIMPDAQELPAWAVSLGVHVLLLVVFWMWRLSSTSETVMEIPSALETRTKPPIKFAVAQDKIGNDTKADKLAPSKTATVKREHNPEQEIARQLEQENLTFIKPQSEPIQQPSQADFVALVRTNGDTHDAGGTEGALDILVREIEASLKQRKTMVVWLFDASQSLNKRRDKIATRFDRIYQQLTDRNNNVHKSLTTAVVAYGEKTNFLTDKPVADVKDVVKAVRNIQPDKSGKEYVFSAMEETMQKYHNLLDSYRRSATRRNVLWVIVTDERGDDYNGRTNNDYLYLDRVIAKLRRHNAKVYCVGNAAIFGREKGYVDFTDDTGYQWKSIAVDQGPESVGPQRLQLPFWGGSSRAIDRLSASYGPYALTRVCAETNGLYLIAAHSVGAIKFPQEVMRKYRPFYGPIPKYLQQLQRSRAKSALDKTARMTLRENIPSPQRTFRADTETALRREIAQAQRPFARLNYHLTEMLNVLKDGEKDRNKITEDRWRAAYDLAMGRMLATKVRAYGYQTMIAEMASTPKSFKSKGNNQWRIVPSSNWQNYPPSIKKEAKAAIVYLKRVIDEHPQTPWALLAEHELGEGKLGWEWREGYRNYPKPRSRNNPDPLLLDEENDPRRKKKKSMKPRQRPKL